MPTTPDPPAAQPEPPFFWWCAVCQSRTAFGYDQLGQFARVGWPVCCGEVVLACKHRGGASPEEAVER